MLIKTIFNKTLSTMANNHGKQAAAYRAVDEWIKNNTAIGIGSGSTIVYAVDRIKQRVDKENLKLFCIPTSYQARQLIIENNLNLSNLEIHSNLDCVIDGADEVDSNLTLIKGGGGCLLQEKIVASCSKSMIVIADSTKNSENLGQIFKYIPIEVVPMAYKPIQEKIIQLFGGTILIRNGISKAGPCVTDNGNFILDWSFPTNRIFNWNDVNIRILLIPGVIDTGLFCNMASKIYFGNADGTVNVKTKN